MTLGAAFPDVLRAAQAGGEWAWARLFDSVAPQVRGYLAAQGASDPENVTGEVLLELVSGIQRFTGDEQGFRSWVFVIAHHRLIDERRRDRRRATVGPMPPQPAAPAPDDDLLQRLAESDWAGRLAQLSGDQRSVILLRVVGGLSAEQVGEIMGKRAGAIRVLQHRALGRLREMLAIEVTK